MLSRSTLLESVSVFCIIFCTIVVFIATKNQYQAWYALHDATWSEIEAAESAIDQRNLSLAENHLKPALAMATAFESQRIILPFPLPGLRDLVITCLGDLGRLYELQGKFQDAISTYRLRLARCERINGENSFATKCCLISLLGSYELQGNYDEAQPIFRLISKRFSLSTQTTPDFAQDSLLVKEYARFLRKMNHENEAITLEQEFHQDKILSELKDTVPKAPNPAK